VGIIIFGVAERIGDVFVGAEDDVEQAERNKVRRITPGAVEMNLKRGLRMGNRLIVYLIACCNCWNEVIQAILLMKSASESLLARKARTAGPTGSSPAAPPGTSA